MRPLLLAAVISAGAFAPGCVVTVEREQQGSEPPVGDAGDAPTAEPAPLEASSDRALLGSLGWALLSEDVPAAVLEVDQLGAELSPETLDALERALREHGGKSDVTRVVTAAEAPDEAGGLLGEDLVALAEEHRDRSSGGDTVALHVLVLPGGFEAEGVPGVAFQATTIALFPEQIRARLPAPADAAAFVSAVAVHELGHTFGLVNRTGVGAFHEDPEHPAHSEDEDSVMYWAVESPTLTELFGGGPPSEFADADRREMQRIRGQRP